MTAEAPADDAAGLPQRLRGPRRGDDRRRRPRPSGRGLLDVHTDPDHHRSAFTLAGTPGRARRRDPRRAPPRRSRGSRWTPRRRASASRRARRRPDRLRRPRPSAGRRRPSALVLADGSGELGLPVFLYGALAGGRTRAAAAPRRSRRAGRADRAPASCAPTSVPERFIRRRARCWSPRGRRWSPSTSSWPRAATLEQARTIAGRDPRGREPRACPGCGRSGCGWRRAAARRSRPTSRIPAASLGRRGRGGRAGTRGSPGGRAGRARPGRGLRRLSRLRCRCADWPRSRTTLARHRARATA